jgi:Fic family protein
MNYVISITEKVGSINSFESLKRMPTLRKNNRIKSIYSSLAIEANSLSINSVKDVLDGKTVLGPLKEIQEVKNAYKAYDLIDTYDPYNLKDLLHAHKVLTDLIIEDSGRFRNHGEGVFDGEKVIFIAPSENMVPQLMENLFIWLKEDNETHLLIKSCVFHYEFVFIHPFSDGNGRMARLWQNVLLNKWNPLFKYVPIESYIQKYQSEYYQTINQCNKNGNSTVFIEFMLKIIDETLDEVLNNTKKETRNISDQVNKLLDIMEFDIPLSANEIIDKLGIKSKETLRGTYLNPALKNGLIRMTLPSKPNSKNQKYIK